MNAELLRNITRNINTNGVLIPKYRLNNYQTLIAFVCLLINHNQQPMY